MIYVYGKRESYQEDEWQGWTSDYDEACRQAESYIERYVDGVIMKLADDGQIEYESHPYVPTPYEGPLARARVQMITPRSIHRTPIDCAKPRLYPLTLDHPWRIVANSILPSPDTPLPPMKDWPMPCFCGDWQEIEGSPEAIAEMVAKYGV